MKLFALFRMRKSCSLKLVPLQTFSSFLRMPSSVDLISQLLFFFKTFSIFYSLFFLLCLVSQLLPIFKTLCYAFFDHIHLLHTLLLHQLIMSVLMPLSPTYYPHNTVMQLDTDIFSPPLAWEPCESIIGRAFHNSAHFYLHRPPSTWSSIDREKERATNILSWVMEILLQKVIVPMCQTSWWEHEAELNRVKNSLEFLPLAYLSYLINCESSFSMLFQFIKLKNLGRQVKLLCKFRNENMRVKYLSKLSCLVRDPELELIYKVKDILYIIESTIYFLSI